MEISRRTFVRAGAAGLSARVAGFAAAAPVRLGCMSGIYSTLPFDEALARIRKAGFRYVCPAAKHAGEAVFAPDTPKAERPKVLRRIKDQGLEPILSLGGFGSEPTTDQGLSRYIAQLDLCADFGIPVMVGGGPWYFQRFPNLPKRQADWVKEVDRFYAGMEKAVRHAESVGVTITLKPHTGITARAKDCAEVVRRIVSDRFKICWDAGNVSFYEGIYPDPDLPDLAPQVKAVCIKDHQGLRGEENFPVPGQGQIDHVQMFRTLFAAGFDGPMGVERVDGKDRGRVPPDVADERLKAAYQFLTAALDKARQA